MALVRRKPVRRFQGPGSRGQEKKRPWPLEPGPWPLTMKLLTRENVLAVLLCLLAILLLIVATGSAPQWIYQGF